MMADYFYYQKSKIRLFAVHLLQHFKLLIEELHVKGEGKVKKAMKESFKILNEVCTPQHHHLWASTSCRSANDDSTMPLCLCVRLGCSIGSRKPV